MFNPPAELRAAIAPTENDPWRGRRLVGEVHDENCWALGGAAGHAGLFGTAHAVGDFARAVLGAFDGSDTSARRGGHRSPIRATLFGGYRVARAGLGHDAADVFVRDEDVGVRFRSHGIYGNDAVDRSGAWGVRRLSHESRESVAREHGDSADSARTARRGIFSAVVRASALVLRRGSRHCLRRGHRSLPGRHGRRHCQSAGSAAARSSASTATFRSSPAARDSAGATRASSLRGLLHADELPLVVPLLALVDLDRCARVLARHTDDAAGRCRAELSSRA